MIKKLFIFAFAGVSLFAGAFDGTYSSKRADIKITESQGVVQFVLLGAGTGSMSSACDLSGNAMILSKNTAGFRHVPIPAGVLSYLTSLRPEG